MHLIPPAADTLFGLRGLAYAWIILIISLALFSYIIIRRYQLIRTGQEDPRFDEIGTRIWNLFSYGFMQKRQPRYLWAGIMHIMIFWGFIVLGLRSIDLITEGLGLPVFRSIMESGFGPIYNTLKDVFELVVLMACVWGILRRAIVKPERYRGSHQFEAYFVLSLISFLMITDMFYEASALRLMGPSSTSGGWLPATQLAARIVWDSSTGMLSTIHNWSYWFHILAFFFFLNFLPLGKHFHIITSLPNVFLRKLKKGSLKPARWGAEDLEDLEYLGVEKLEDFTWKHMLDFFSCTECGRCTDMCPADAIGRPLSPKMITIKLRDYGYDKFPLWKRQNKGESNKLAIVGDLIKADEIWSCTTCGACEEECPIFIEYIDKIIDMRRHFIETSQNPKTFNQVLMHVEKTGNPFGKPAAKRSEWINEIEDVSIKMLKEGDEVDLLYFVDSYGSYDPQVQAISSAIVKGLNLAGIDFGILGPLEKDTGHQVRRIGEEGLLQFLVEENMETLNSIRFKRIITTDPHAFNTLKNDYPASFEVSHYSQFFLSLIEKGDLKPTKRVMTEDIYTYHDPCYLGRHNEIYEGPRRLLRSIPGLQLVEMERSRDRSFCCGGGDIILWHEIEKENMRMADKRIQMAGDAGANKIVTACPFCLIHFEDAIKTGGLEEKMGVVDLMELLMSTMDGKQ
jgi:Fe-S oxidoreductase